jgi:hypothetical protein
MSYVFEQELIPVAVTFFTVPGAYTVTNEIFGFEIVDL